MNHSERRESNSINRINGIYHTREGRGRDGDRSSVTSLITRKAIRRSLLCVNKIYLGQGGSVSLSVVETCDLAVAMEPP